MASQKGILDAEHIKLALAFQTYGTPDGKPYIFIDAKTSGLQARVQGKKAAWYVKKDLKDASHTIWIADLTEIANHATTITAPAKARELAEVVIGFLKHGRKADIKPFLEIFYAKRPGMDTSRTVAPLITQSLRELEERLQAERDQQRHSKSWTFRTCVEKAIEEKSDPSSSRHIAEKTVKDYRNTFDRHEFEDVMAMPVTEVTARHVERVRDLVKVNAGTKGQSSARKVITYTREVLNFICSNFAEAGLDMGNPWWRMLSAPWKPEVRDRRPELEDIVRSMILAEEYTAKPLPGRMVEKSSIKPGTLAGLWWLVLTGQRSGAGLQLLQHDVIPDPHDRRYMLAGWDKGVMKAGVTFTLPIPVEAWKLIDKWREKGRHHGLYEWAFPSEKEKEKHVTGSGVYQILSKLAGRKELVQSALEEAATAKAVARIAAGKKPRKRAQRSIVVDLFAENGIPWWSPHDLRKAITATLNAHDIAGGASAILAHESIEKESLAITASEKARADFAKRRQAKVTKIAYGHSQQIDLKKEAISIWCQAVLDEYHRQTGERFRSAAE